VGGLDPYEHQRRTLEAVQKAVATRQTTCLINASVTGSGKTLANFATAILHGTPTVGVYPTNELMTDQWAALVEAMGQDNIRTVDSEGLDDIQQDEPQLRSHAQALAWVTGDHLPNALLTNPDVLYLAMYDLYGQMYSTYNRSFGERIFQHILNNYPVIAFDEFHLYDVKQVANAAFIVGTAARLAPDKPHVFIFSSATPRSSIRPYLERLGLKPMDVTANPSSDPGDRVVCEPVTIEVLPADLLRWKGGDTMYEALDGICRWADAQNPPARGVFIFDSVYEAKRLAAVLRARYGSDTVGEVHGYMDKQARGGALQRRFSVGTTTIDVGVDLTGPKSKEFLIAEARSAAAAVQRIGRLGRRGREPNTADFPVPNHIWLIVPHYVHSRLSETLPKAAEIPLDRNTWIDHLNEAYLGHQDFAAYARYYSPLEAVAATERILGQYKSMGDTLPAKEGALHRLVPALYEIDEPATAAEAENKYAKMKRRQYAIWRQYGQSLEGARNRFYLSDLESFRGGMESQLTIAIYDETDAKLGIFPARSYNLAFVLRRAQWEPMTEEAFTKLLRQKYPGERTEIELTRLARHNVLGYVHVTGLIQGKANEMYLELGKSRVTNFERVIRVENGFTIGPGDHRLLRINTALKKRTFNCWVSQYSGFHLSNTQHLPPLFAIYPLQARDVGGKSSDWSIALGLDAFLLDSIYQGRIRRQSSHRDDGAVFDWEEAVK
jgi:CRISPR-associated helicase Cas3